jgi:hypothetical protein
MSISSLIPAAGAAGVFAARAAQSLAGGASFADIFRKADAAQPSSSGPEFTPTTTNPASARPSQSTDPKQLLADFQELLKRKLAGAGIDISQPIELRGLNRDTVKVGGEHSDWAKIEQLFDEDPALRDAFNKLANAYSRENPSSERFQLTLRGDSAEVTFA